jgi:hypothetical protein
MTLPPHVPETDFGNIPAPVGWIVGPCGQFHPNPASEVNGPGSVAWSIPCYTESSMRAYATAAVLAEREACALLCEPVAVERQDIGGPARTFWEQPQNCAGRIRARNEE